MSKAGKKQVRVQLTVNVLNYQEDGLHTAHCLDIDLKGRGATPFDAITDLLELLEMQITFALAKGQLELLHHPAEPKYFEIWRQLEEAKREQTAPPEHLSGYGMLPLPMPYPDRDSQFQPVLRAS